MLFIKFRQVMSGVRTINNYNLNNNANIILSSDFTRSGLQSGGSGVVV